MLGSVLIVVHMFLVNRFLDLASSHHPRISLETPGLGFDPDAALYPFACRTSARPVNEYL